MKIPPKTVHNWRVRGVLVDEIKAAFFKVPEPFRGSYFLWFLQNQDVIGLAGQPVSGEQGRADFDRMVCHAWRFIGGDEHDSPTTIKLAIQRRNKDDQQCFWLWVFLLSQSRPGPNEVLFVEFGFVASEDQEEEMELAGLYLQLIRACTFDEFCDAYRSRRMLDLFHSNGLHANHSAHIQDLLHGPAGMIKSVWHLKQFILQDATGHRAHMTPAVTVDYGFRNCQNEAERQQVKRVYKAFFEDRHGDPLALHEAAIQGNLHNFLSKTVRGLRDPKFQRLMKNPYPLLDP